MNILALVFAVLAFFGCDASGIQKTWNQVFDRPPVYHPTQPVPEPCTVAVLGIGVSGVIAAKARRRR